MPANIVQTKYRIYIATNFTPHPITINELKLLSFVPYIVVCYVP